jgi:hypothetical protein
VMGSREGTRAASYLAVTARVARRRVLQAQGVSSGINGYVPAVCRNAGRNRPVFDATQFCVGSRPANRRATVLFVRQSRR